MNDAIETIRWREGRVRILDQRRLPGTEAYIDIEDPAGLIRAVKTLAVRGAPALGIAGAYGVALAAAGLSIGDGTKGMTSLRRAALRIRAARPTAVNLHLGVDRAMAAAEDVRDGGTGAWAARVRAVGDRLLAEDLESSRAMARHGAPLVPVGRPVLTHCNTGGLATGGLGTALAVARAAFELGTIPEVLADETRPLLQGGRLTLWELRRWGVPCRVIPDGAAAWAMARLNVGCVLVGADRIARNGDTANKIGTYQLALAARAHGIPLYVVAPETSFDRGCPDGASIDIEERDAAEVTRASGWTPAAGARAFNPAFDVTPASLIAAWISDRGVLSPPFLPL